MATKLNFLLLLIAVAFGPIQTWYISSPDFCHRPKPWSLSDIRPDLQVYTRDKINSTTIQNVTSLLNFVQRLDGEKFFSPDRQVVFLVHGYMGHMPWSKDMYNIKNALLNAKDSTVFVVVWSKGADVFYNYAESVSNTQTMATFLSNLSSAILNSATFKGDEDLLYMHCIGHSLGAHICGQAGRSVGIFDRATGLDPAGPGFEKCADHLHIDVDSAACVDNIHTDGTSDGHWDPIVSHFGTLESWGHIDFYPNGGRHQPGCRFNDFPPCSHSRAPKLFAYTIESGPNICLASGTCNGTRTVLDDCDNNITQPLGYFSSCHRGGKNLVPGIFDLPTGKATPYC